MNKAVTSLVLLLLVGAIAGCSKNHSVSDVSGPGAAGGTAMQEAEVNAALATAPDLIEDGIAEDDAQASFSLSGEAGAGVSADIGNVTDVEIRPFYFWRRITDVRRRFEIAFADTDSTGQPTTAHVTVHKRLEGSFNILAKLPSATAVATDDRFPLPSDTSLTLVRKKLLDHWTRRLLLKRISRAEAAAGGEVVADAGDARARWRIAAISNVSVTSDPNTTQIESIRIEAGTRDTTIADPLALMRLRRLLKFESGQEVKLTVTTNHSDDVVVLNYRALRLRFHNNGDGTHTAVFHAAWLAGVHHFGVNALSRGTLFDSEAPYDSDAWILAYVVVPTELADYRP